MLVVDVFADEFDLVFNPCFIIESDGDDVDGFGMRGFRGSRKIEMHGMSQFLRLNRNVKKRYNRAKDVFLISWFMN